MTNRDGSGSIALGVSAGVQTEAGGQTVRLLTRRAALKALLPGLLIGLPVVLSAAPSLYTSPRASVLVIGGSMMNGNQFADGTLPVMRVHFRGCRRVALVLHASHPADKNRMEVRLQAAFAHLGVAAAESLHRRDAAGARELLTKADGIFVGGGETFVLLGELHRTGQLALIRERVLAGVPYAGSSAGANIAGLIIGTTNDFPVAEIPSREALGLLPATINPHHPLPVEKTEYASRVGKIKIYLQFNPGETVLALANASMLRLHGGRAQLAAGTGWIYRQAEMRELKLGELVPELSP